jgi:hypothetical protein
MTHPRSALSVVLTVLLITLVGCADRPGDLEMPEDGRSLLTEDGHAGNVPKILSAKKRERARLIRTTAAAVGLNNAVLLAGIANSETNMSHCWSEATWACQGPASSSCDGGPVIAGSGDGPCSLKQGGLGYFQFDAGTHTQTLNRYGQDVLTVEGNTRHAVDYVVDMVIRSVYIDGVADRSQALAWLNTVRVDGTNWDAWIETVVHYYNGCVPGRCSVYASRTNKYSDATRSTYRELGNDFWYGGGEAGVTPVDPPIGDLSEPTSLAPATTSVANGGSVDLSWAAVPGAQGYDLNMEYYVGDQWQTYHTWTGRTQTRFTVWPQAADTTYSWRVRACAYGSCSDWSSFAGFGVGSAPARVGDDAPPSEPDPVDEPPIVPDPVDETDPVADPVDDPVTGIAAPGSVSPAGGTISTPSVDLTWSEVDGAVTYDIDMQYVRGGSWTAYYTWTDKTRTVFTVWPQADSTDYRWRVRACGANQCSPYTSWETFSFTGL